MIVVCWCLKDIPLKEYKLTDLVNVMLQTAHLPQEKAQMEQYMGSHGTTALITSAPVLAS